MLSQNDFHIRNSYNIYGFLLCVCVRACVRACMRAYVRAYVCVLVNLLSGKIHKCEIFIVE